MRDQLKQNSILRGQGPRRQLEELVVPRQRPHFTMELALNLLRPCVEYVCGRINHRPVALANNRERLKHVIENDSVWLMHSQFTTDRVEASIDSNRRIAETLTCPDPLFVAPVESANCRGGRVVAFVAQLEVARHAADLLVGKVANQLLDRARRNLRPDVNEQDHLRRGLRQAGVDRNRLASVLFKDDGLDTRMLLASQQFCRAVGRAIRDDDDLLNTWII